MTYCPRKQKKNTIYNFEFQTDKSLFVKNNHEQYILVSRTNLAHVIMMTSAGIQTGGGQEIMD